MDKFVQVTKTVESKQPVLLDALDVRDRINHELWVEKYRPKKLEDIVGNDTNLKIIHQWFKDFQEKKPNTKRALLLGGPPGLGKTSLAHVILEEYGYQVKEYNASDVRSKKLVQSNLDQLINISCVDKMVSSDYNPIGIVMDEVDGMSSGDKGGMAELIQFINPNRGKRSVKKEDRELADKRWIPPIICICNNRHDKKILNLKKDCIEIVFSKPTNKDLIKIIDRITTAENFSIKESSKTLIAKYAQGDYRRLLFLLQNLFVIHGEQSEISDEDVLAQYQLFCQKEVELTLYETVDKLLNQSLSATETLKIYESDKSLLPMMVHENYVHFISMQCAPSIFHQLDEIQETIDSIVEGDIIDKTMYNNQSWYLQPIHGISACFIPAYYINIYKKVYSQKSQFTTALGKFSLHCSNRKNINSIISTVNSRNSYNVGDVRVLSDLILYYAFVNEVPGRGQPKTTETDEFETIQICVELLKRYNLQVEDIDKLIKMNKLNDFYKNLTSIGRTKTALKKLYGSEEPFYKVTKKNLNHSMSSINCPILQEDEEEKRVSPVKKKVTLKKINPDDISPPKKKINIKKKE